MDISYPPLIGFVSFRCHSVSVDWYPLSMPKRTIFNPRNAVIIGHLFQFSWMEFGHFQDELYSVHYSERHFGIGFYRNGFLKD